MISYNKTLSLKYSKALGFGATNYLKKIYPLYSTVRKQKHRMLSLKSNYKKLHSDSEEFSDSLLDDLEIRTTGNLVEFDESEDHIYLVVNGLG